MEHKSRAHFSIFFSSSWKFYRDPSKEELSQTELHAIYSKAVSPSPNTYGVIQSTSALSLMAEWCRPGLYLIIVSLTQVQLQHISTAFMTAQLAGLITSLQRFIDTSTTR